MAGNFLEGVQRAFGPTGENAEEFLTKLLSMLSPVPPKMTNRMKETGKPFEDPLALIRDAMNMGGSMALEAGMGPVKGAGKGGRALYQSMPKPKRLYREVGPEEAATFVDPGVGADMTLDSLFAATKPELALSQSKTSRGIVLELDPSGLKSQVSRTKPGIDASGIEEHIMRLNKQGQYRDSVRSVTIKPDAIGDKAYSIRLKRFLEKSADWVREALEDGSVKFTKRQ